MDFREVDTSPLFVSIILHSCLLLLIPLLWHANANLVLEQRDLVDLHFPPGGGGGGGAGAGPQAVAPLPAPEPPKPKPATATQNAQLADIRAKISNVQNLLDQPAAAEAPAQDGDRESARLMIKEESKEAGNPMDASQGKLISPPAIKK